MLSLFLLLAFAQEPPPQEGPQVKINVLNVCTPSEDDHQEIKAALAKLPAKPVYTADFEISRGRSSLETAPQVRYVRLRRDMDAASPLATTQYSLSVDAEKMIETLVLRFKEDKDLHVVILEDQVSTGTVSPAAVLTVDTPVTRIKLERFGKAPLVMAKTHCEHVDQSAYEPLFREASRLLVQYRKSLGLRSMFRGDVAWLSQPEKPAAKAAVAEPKTK